jgi:hypothetical protein
MRQLRPAPFIACLLLGAMAACGGTGDTPAAERPPAHVDSIRPIGEELRRFRAELRDSVDALSGGAASISELAARFVAALERGDRAAIEELALTPAEFAYLYYPHTQFTRRPYEMPPSLVWFQLQNYGSRGLHRALERYGERPLRHAGHVCQAPPAVEGPNRIWQDCFVRLIGDAGDTATVRLFGAILEYGGHFKFVNYANRL